MATTRRPAAPSWRRIGRKSSLLPVKPGTSRAGRRSHTPVAGSASNAANEPRSVGRVIHRTPGGTSMERGVLTGGHPTDRGLLGTPGQPRAGCRPGLAGVLLAGTHVLARPGTAADPLAAGSRALLGGRGA